MKNIELFPHNQKTYENIKEMWKTTNRVTAIQATGTGKSYLILKCLSDIPNEQKIVLAPSSYILEQLVKEAGGEIENTVLMTYADLSFDIENKINNLKPTLICLDEFHRCGAEKWGTGVQKLLEMYPNAKVLGTSATHIRFLDGSRDMADEIFEGNVAVNLSLVEAIIKEILAMPKYVSALYTFEEVLDDLKNKVKTSSNSDESKKGMLKEIDIAKNKLNRSKGIPNILKKHINLKNGKFIVFCKNIKHLNEMKNVVSDWFIKSKVTKKVDMYSIYSEYEDGDRELEQFKNNNSKDSTKLLFSINMFNEGIHIKDVTGVILLRPTTSPIIYYQQIGRSIQVGGNKEPLIFDFVNNFDNIGAAGFVNDLKEEIEKELKEECTKGSKERLGKLIDFMVFDETLEVKDLFSGIEDRLDLWGDWDAIYEKLVIYKNNNDNCDVPRGYKGNRGNVLLDRWVGKQREGYKKGKLLQDRIQKLEEIGFVWSILDNAWNVRYNELIKYREAYGNCNVPDKYIENNSLGHWIKDQRKAYKRLKLHPYKIKKLEEIEFKWRVLVDTWDIRYSELIKYKEEFENCNVPSKYKENKALGAWVGTQRLVYAEHNLEQDKIHKLENLGFIWDLPVDKWNNMYKELVKHKNIYGHCRVSRNNNGYKTLANWVNTQKTTYKRGKLSEDRVNKLQEIGLKWELTPHVEM
jgi:superfamily II DNA or RNA helicase